MSGFPLKWLLFIRIYMNLPDTIDRTGSRVEMSAAFEFTRLTALPYRSGFESSSCHPLCRLVTWWLGWDFPSDGDVMDLIKHQSELN